MASSDQDQELEPLPRRKLFTFPLHRRDSIGSTYHVLTFEASEPIAALPGQFAMVHAATWGQAPLLPRPMSLLSAGDRPSILIKVVGEGTRRMAHASSGQPFTLLMPLGRPWSPCPPDHRAVLVADALGVASLLFFAREMTEADPGKRPLALYGGRAHADLPLDADLGCVSELRLATLDGSRGSRGELVALLERTLDEFAASGVKAKVYAAGSSSILAAAARTSEAHGVPCEVSLETPMACGYGVCLGCPVAKRDGGFLYACTEGVCVDAARIDWSRQVLP